MAGLHKYIFESDGVVAFIGLRMASSFFPTSKEPQDHHFFMQYDVLPRDAKDIFSWQLNFRATLVLEVSDLLHGFWRTVGHAKPIMRGCCDGLARKDTVMDADNTSQSHVEVMS